MISVNGKKVLFKKISEEKLAKAIIIHKKSDFALRFVLGCKEKGLFNDEKIADFFSPKIKNHIGQNAIMQDFKIGAKLLIGHLISKIAILGDYDVDGACSSALLKRFLLHLGVKEENIMVFIPDRVKDGYGPTVNAIKNLHEWGAKLIITVDCGIVAFEPIDFASTLAIDVIILDHHIPSEKGFPSAKAVINPNRSDDLSGMGSLCAAGVVFLFCAFVANKMGVESVAKPFLLQNIDLVALATVCDVVPLLEINRAFVKQGLKVLKNTQNKGLLALMNVANITFMEEVNAKTLGFVLGPLINAGGRVGESTCGTRLLSTESNTEAENLAKILVSCNTKRIQEEKMATMEAIKRASDHHDEVMIFEFDSSWHEGIVGIVASRINERYKKVAIIGSKVIIDKKMAIKASCRSTPQVDIGKIVLEAVQNGLLLKGGGHSAAAGFTVLLSKVEELKAFFSSKIEESIMQAEQNNNILLDGIIGTEAICNKDFLNEIESLEPFGRSNEAPFLMIKGAYILKATIIKEEHIQVTFSCNNQSVRKNGFIFRGVGTTTGDVLLSGVGKMFDLICKINRSFFRNIPQIDITICDAVKQI